MHLKLTSFVIEHTALTTPHSFLWFPRSIHVAMHPVLTQFWCLSISSQTNTFNWSWMPSRLAHKLPITALFFPIPLLLPWLTLLLSLAKTILIIPNWYFCDWTSLFVLSFTISGHIPINTDVIMSLVPHSTKWSTNDLYQNLPTFLLNVDIPRPHSPQTYWIRRNGPPTRNQQIFTSILSDFQHY